MHILRRSLVDVSHSCRLVQLAGLYHALRAGACGCRAGTWHLLVQVTGWRGPHCRGRPISPSLLCGSIVAKPLPCLSLVWRRLTEVPRTPVRRASIAPVRDGRTAPRRRAPVALRWMTRVALRRMAPVAAGQMVPVALQARSGPEMSGIERVGNPGATQQRMGAAVSRRLADSQLSAFLAGEASVSIV
jgi:hypothetical protein